MSYELAPACAAARRAACARGPGALSCRIRAVTSPSPLQSVDSRRHIRVALSSSLADSLLSDTLRLAHLPSRSRLACSGHAGYPSIPKRPTDHAAMPSSSAATAGAPSPFPPSCVANMYSTVSSILILPLSSASGQPSPSPPPLFFAGSPLPST